jgi:hypothetical protein
MDRDLQQRLDRIDKKLNALAAQQRKETWVGHSWVTDLTGWDFRKLEQARKQNVIEFKKSETGGYLYKLESIPEIFIKQKQAS